MNDLSKDFDSQDAEARCAALWEETGIYRYDPRASGLVFSVDTPPPYVSADHLHVGHAMSYAQAEFIVRYQRMKGRNIFYPMGFDDNGLPTERYVEKAYGLNKKTTTRRAFRELCLEVTRKGAAEYEKLWRALGLSVDWELRYSTIDDHCRHTSQKSFIDLYRKNAVYRAEEPVLWDTHFECALAQADLETLTRKGSLHSVTFRDTDGAPITIATTRPELIPACVAIYCNPNDARYSHLVGRRAVVPIFEYEVPILGDEDVDPEFGTGLMMVCTFGDGEDVRRWKRDKLDLRVVVGPDGKMQPLAGKYAGKTVEQARSAIVKDLKSENLIVDTKTVEQNVSVSERSGTPVEFVTATQWFVRVLDIREDMLRRSSELVWHPEWMKARLDQWIEGLKYDWNISRQRFYGVTFPVWYCASCGEVILPSEEALPVDPAEEPAPVSECPRCGGREFRGETDVMDTWMTSSVSPLINANWAGTPGRKGTMDIYPMTVRVQAFEIIRTWLFYALVKSHRHTGTLPWAEVMISGWGLNENGKKISKSDLEQYTDEAGYNRYEPYAVLRRYGADALRYWAAGSHLGNDMRYNERDVKNGRRIVVKLWNSARFVTMQVGSMAKATYDTPFDLRTPEDRWVIAELQRTIQKMTEAFDSYNYAVARETIDRFFWTVFCDDYLEMVKDRFWKTDQYSEEMRNSARSSMTEVLRILLALYAPFLPFVTEELYQRLFRESESEASIHVTRWPEYVVERDVEVEDVTVLLGILRTVRRVRTERRIPQSRQLASLIIDVGNEGPSALLARIEPSLLAVVRANKIKYAPATITTELPDVRIELVEQVTEPVAEA